MNEATSTTIRGNERVREELPFVDRQDFEDARHGFIATLSPMIIESTEGRPVWDMESFAFIAPDVEAPSSVNPSLWRQSQLVGIHGLFEVVPGIYQVRGFDLSNVTFVEGDRGVVVIDPLISNETAAAALALYREHRGDRPVVGVIYTHSHVDHFGGVKGIVSQGEVDRGDVPIVAPEHFLEHAVSENVFAGVAMSRRAAYMYGALLRWDAISSPSSQAGPSTCGRRRSGARCRSAGTSLVCRPWSPFPIQGTETSPSCCRRVGRSFAREPQEASSRASTNWLRYRSW